MIRRDARSETMSRRSRAPPIKQFEVAEVSGGPGWIVGGHDGLAIGMSVIEIERESSCELVVRADVDNGSQAVASTRRTPGIAKDKIVVGSAPLIPEIRTRCELQEVDIRTQRELLPGGIDDLRKFILAVHEVIKREAGIGACGRKDLEEGVVHGVGGMVVAGAAEIAAAQPWLAGQRC